MFEAEKEAGTSFGIVVAEAFNQFCERHRLIVGWLEPVTL
jgi:hypothetical protein